MFNSNSFLNIDESAFGLDISGSSLKIIKFRKERKGLSLASFGSVEMEKGIIEKGEIKDEDKLSDYIKKAISQARGEKIKTKYVVTSLPEEKSFFHLIKMPKMKKEELRKALGFEVENYIPLSSSDVYFDFEIMGTAQNSNEWNVLLSAMPKKTVDSYVRSLKQANLMPIALETELQAITRALIKKGNPSDPVLIADIGVSKTSLVIFSGYSLLFSVSLPISSVKFSEAIAKNLNINFNEAEDLKIKYGATKKNQDVFNSLIPILTDFTEQVKKYFNYYHSRNFNETDDSSKKKINKILLCGGGSKLKGLKEFLNADLGVLVEHGNPWTNVSLISSKNMLEFSEDKSLSWAGAIGLALRGIEHD